MKNKLSFILIIFTLFYFSPAVIFAQLKEETKTKPEEFNLKEADQITAAQPPEEISEEPALPEAPTTAQEVPLPETQKSASFLREGSTISQNENKISLDIKGMDIVDVLKLLAQRAAMNLVLGKNVTGKVTLFLKDVKVEDAFEIILLANDLAYQKKGNIINVMTQRDYELQYGERFQDPKQVKIIPLKYAKAGELSKSLNQIKSNIGRIIADEASNTLVLIDSPEKINEMTNFIKNTDLLTETRVFSLNYATVEKIAPKIQEAITKGVGSVKIDERTNKIAVTDFPEKLKEIEKILAAFDERTLQVLIDAQLIQVNPSDKFEMGIDWDYWVNKYFEAKARLPINTDNTLFIGTISTAPGERGEYKAVLDILRTIGDTKVLSSPRIMALNNQEAKIHVGKKDAYITSTTSQSGTGTTVTSQSVNFVDTGIQLSVTPTINRDGFVTMKIKPEISDAERVPITSADQKTEIPLGSTTDAETTVMVRDGVTIIIGGLAKDKRVKTVKKIPLLGDIPGVGFFFRSTSDNLSKEELVILLTPHIISGETTYSDFSEIKPKDGAVAKMERGKIVIEKTTKLPQRESLKVTDSEYYKLVADKVRELALFGRPKREKGEIKLAFTLSCDGNLVKEPYIIQTDNLNLGNSALKAVKDACPFPPFPKELQKKEETFKISLSYE